MHDNNIVHRDLKPDNLMIDDDGFIKIIDFSLSQMLPSGGFFLDAVGTPSYLAPEMIKKKSDKRADWWAVGVIIYELLVGSTPFYRQNQHDMFREILKGQILFPSEKETSTSPEFR